MHWKMRKYSVALVLSLIVSMLLCTSGAFAQSTNDRLGNSIGAPLGHQAGLNGGITQPIGGNHLIRITRVIRVTRTVQVVRLLRVVKLVRTVRVMQVTQLQRVTLLQKRAGCNCGAIRVTRLVRVTRAMRAVKLTRVVRVTRAVRLVRVTQLQRVTLWRSAGGCSSCAA